MQPHNDPVGRCARVGRQCGPGVDTLTRVITGELKSKIDRIWDAFWSGGISNPIEVIEQLTYLLFIRRLDELQTLKENQARRLKQPLVDPTFLPGQDHLRWSRLKNTCLLYTSPSPRD